MKSKDIPLVDFESDMNGTKVLIYHDLSSNKKVPIYPKLFNSSKYRFFRIDDRYLYWQYGYSFNESFIFINKRFKLYFKKLKKIRNKTFYLNDLNLSI